MAGFLGAGDRRRLADTLVAAVQREYPHQLAQELQGDADLAPPRRLHPSFYGSYDWHSAVHCHWSMLRCAARQEDEAAAGPLVGALDRHLRPDRLAGELAFFEGPGGRTAERPYGWSWLVRLRAECVRLGDAPGTPGGLAESAAGWADALAPLAGLLRSRLIEYLSVTLAHPVRAGTHANTAFALDLLRQAAVASRDGPLGTAVGAATRRWFEGEERLPWFLPPSGNDFLDPNLTEAALVADAVDADRLARWLHHTGAGDAPRRWAEPPAFRPDGRDPGTVHLEGLVLSKAWCLRRLAVALGGAEPWAGMMAEALDRHVEAARALDPTDGFARAHWLPTFAVVLDDALGGGWPPASTPP